MGALTAALFRLVWLLPATADPWLARWLTGALRHCGPRLHSRLLDHLRLVFGTELARGDREALAERFWQGFGRSVVEFIRLGRAEPLSLRRTTVCRGLGHVARAAAAGHGWIALSAHYGNFELVPLTLVSRGYPVAVLVREKDDAAAEGAVTGIRRRHGAEVLHKTELRRAVARLRAGHGVVVAADQAVLVGGVMADFLGIAAPSPLGPVVLARLSHAPLLPVFIHRDANGRQHLEVHAALHLPHTGEQESELQQGAELLNRVVSAQIRSTPAEWLWLHRRWKAPLSLRSRPGMGSCERGA